MPSESGAAWTPPASSERRLSNSSDGSAGSGYSKTLSSDNAADFLATRPHTAAVIPGKPAANPLQFVKVGPAELGSRAREQLRKAELAKKTEPAKIEIQEDWQSNLDSWKSTRRKRVEHIIERCVETRRMETGPQPRGKSKTFNEMLEERAGRRRPNRLALYTDDDAHDLSDLGIGTSSTKSSLSEDCDTHSLASDGIDLDKNHSDVDNCDLPPQNPGSSANEYDTCTTATTSSPEPEEYTYEGAIEGYKSRISQTNTILKTPKETSPEKTHNGDLNRIRTVVSNKIEEKVSSLQQATNDIKNIKKDLPKVDIHKRREQFERENSQELTKPKVEIANKISIKERMSSLGKFSEDTQIQKSNTDLTKLPVEVKPLKERLSSLEKVKAASTEIDKTKKLSNGDLSNTRSLKDRLTSLKTQKSEEEVKIVKTEVKEVSMSLKERLSCLESAKNKEIPKIAIEEQIETKAEDYKEQSTALENQMQSFYRSLDSLDINGQSSPNSFERVQSLEDFDCADLQNNTAQSDIETEDSGIHTARDSCVPSDDMGDLNQVASPYGEQMVEISEYESSNEDFAAPSPKIEDPDMKTPEPITSIIDDVIIEEVEEQDASRTEDTDSGNYLQAVSQPEELSVTSEITEIQMDKDDEDTLKSLDNQDTSVSLNEPASTSSDGDTVVFEGKMTIHLNLNEICNTAGAGTSKDSTNRNSMPMVTVSNITTTNISPKNSIKSLRSCTDSHNTLTNNVTCSANTQDHAAHHTHTDNNTEVIDALELAFQELDSEDSFANTSATTPIKKSETIQDKVTEDIVQEPKAKIPEVDTKVEETQAPLYENMEVFYQNGGDVSFPLDPPANVLEPPKEKPPPPPTEEGDELLGNGNFKHTSSARRIKKEIRNKRTSFLGIEGQDDSYLDVDLTLAPRPDITSFLQEETKIEKLLYKKTLSHDMDAKLRDSRDSGVDVDRGSSVENWYKGSSPDTSNSHSRQNSEPYNNVTVTSDEEEVKKRDQAFTSDLTSKLTDLTSESGQDRTGQDTTQDIETLDKKLQESQGTNVDWPDGVFDDAHTKEVLRFERELLQLEQEELRRQRDNLMRDQTRIIQKSVQDISAIPEKPPLNRPKTNTHRHSMPNLLANETLSIEPPTTKYDDSVKRKPFVSEEHIQSHFGVEESRRVLYEYERPRVPPPPKIRSKESMEREITMRSSRVPSAGDYVNVNSVQLRTKPVHHAPLVQGVQGPQGVQQNGQYHPMTRHTLQALSAAPTPKLISNNDWLQSRSRKPANYNYNQHWLIQEAEQRRIEEQRLKMRAQRHSYHKDAPQPMHRMRHLSNSQQHLQYTSRPAPPPVPPSIPPRDVIIRDPIPPRDVIIRDPIPPRDVIIRDPIPPRDAIIRDTIPPRDVMSRDVTSRDMHRDAIPPRDASREDKILSVSGKRKCSHCGEELGRGAAMIIESLSLCYHVWCFSCAACGAALGDGRRGADVRVRAGRLHCAHCYSGDGETCSRV